MAKLGDQLADVGDTSDALLCFGAWSHFIRERPLGSSPTNVHAVLEVLDLYVKYGRVLRKVTHIQDIGDEPQPQRVFGAPPLDHWTLDGIAAERSSEEAPGMVVLPHSFIYTDAVREAEKGSASRLGSSGILLARQRTTELISACLNSGYNKLLDVLLEAIDRAKMTAPFDICFRHIMTGQCSFTSEQCSRVHPAPEELNVRFFNNRVRLHLLVIAVIDQFVIERGEISEGKKRLSRQR